MNSQKNGFAHLIVIFVIALTVVVGAGAYVVTQNKNDEATTNNSAVETVDTSLTEPLPGDLLPVERIKELTIASTPNATIVSIELEKEDSGFIYKVHLADGTYLLFNASTGETVATQSSKDDSTETDEALPAGFVAAISFDKAREVALAAKPDGTISKIELELEEGTVVYSVRFTDDWRIEVDATTGEIVRQKSGSDDTNSTDDDSSENGNSSSGSSDGSESGSSSSDDDDEDDDNSGSSDDDSDDD